MRSCSPSVLARAAPRQRPCDAVCACQDRLMNGWLARALGLSGCVLACGNAEDGNRTPNGDTPAVEASAPERYCNDVGPPCGLTVTFEPLGLAIGTYFIEITTSAGVTSCELAVEPERLQTAAEAEAQDAMLQTCSAQGTCPPGPCAGPNTVYVRPDGLTIVEESSEISILVRDVATGMVATQSFEPSYSDHPARTAECHTCRVAADSMLSPP
jgi:hypothetical protein